MYDSLDTIRPGDLDLIIVGAGIAGLSAALTATAASKRTLVLDAHGAGGRARTTHHDGFAHNVGPHALYRSGHLRGLLARHDISVSGRRPDVASANLLRDGALTPLTLRATDILRTTLLGRRDRVRLLALLASTQRTKASSLVGRSVDEWLADQRQPVRQFVDMLVRLSTYTNAPAEFDAGAALQQIQLALSTGVDYLDGGWGVMVAAMVEQVRARGGEFVTGAEVNAVAADGTRIDVHVGDRVFRGTSVILAAGGPSLVERLTGVRPAGHERLTGPVQAATLDLAVRRPHHGLVLGLDRPLYLSPHAPVARLAPEGCGLVSLMQYVPESRAIAVDPNPDRDADRHELRSLARLAGIDDADVVHERYSHRLVVSHGSPSAVGGGMAGRPGTSALGIRGIHLAGDWVGPVGLLADASAASGEAAAVAALTTARAREHAV
jgi:phytoene dehydrogenase-like protein